MINYHIMTIRIYAIQHHNCPSYAPATGAMELETELVCQPRKVLKQVPQKDIVYTLDAFSAKVGSQVETGIAGNFGLWRGMIQVIIGSIFAMKIDFELRMPGPISTGVAYTLEQYQINCTIIRSTLFYSSINGPVQSWLSSYIWVPVAV